MPISDSNPTLFLALFLPQISLLQLKNQQLIKKHNDNGGFAPLEDIDMRSETIQRRLHGGNGGSGRFDATGKGQGGGMGRRKAALAVQTHVRGWLARSGFDGEQAAKRAQRWRATETRDATDGDMEGVPVQRTVRTRLHQGMERVAMQGMEQGTDWNVAREGGAGGSDEEQSRAERDREGIDEQDGHAITGGAGEREMVRTKPNTPTSPPVYTAGWVKMPASLNPLYRETVHTKLQSAGTAQEGDGDESGGGESIEGNEEGQRGMGRAAGVHRTVSAIDALRSIRSVRSVRFVSEEEGGVAKVQRQQRIQHGAAMSSTTFRAAFNRNEPTANDEGGGGGAGGAGVRAIRMPSTGMRSLNSIRSIGSVHGSIQQRSSMISRLRSSCGGGGGGNGDGDGDGDGDGGGGNGSNGGGGDDEKIAGAIVEALAKSHRIKVNEYLRRRVSENRDTLTNAIVQSNRHGFSSTFDDVFVNLIMEHFPASEGIAALCDTLEAAEQENISLCMTLQAAKEENQLIPGMKAQTASAIAAANAAAKTAARASMDGSKLLEKLEEKATKLGGMLGFIGEDGDDGGSGIDDGGGEGGGASIMRLQTTRTAMATALASAVEGIDVDAIVEEMHDLYDQLDNAETDNMMLEREMNAMQLKLRQKGSEKIQPAHPLWGVACRYAEEREEVQER